MFKLAIVLSTPTLYYSVWESAILLGGKRTDNQSFDEVGWWVRSISLEFAVPEEKIERFERDLRAIYDGFITICYEHMAALTT